MSRRVKEKGPVRKATAERFKTAPKELVRRGLDDGTERLKGQLRDNRDRERPQDYGSEKIEGGAERGAALAGRSVEAFLKHRKQELEREKSADTKESETGMPLESETTVEPSEAPPTADAPEVPIPAESDSPEYGSWEAREKPADSSKPTVSSEDVPSSDRQAHDARVKERTEPPVTGKPESAKTHTPDMERGQSQLSAARKGKAVKERPAPESAQNAIKEKGAERLAAIQNGRQAAAREKVKTPTASKTFGRGWNPQEDMVSSSAPVSADLQTRNTGHYSRTPGASPRDTVEPLRYGPEANTLPNRTDGAPQSTRNPLEERYGQPVNRDPAEAHSPKTRTSETKIKTKDIAEAIYQHSGKGLDPSKVIDHTRGALSPLGGHPEIRPYGNSADSQVLPYVNNRYSPTGDEAIVELPRQSAEAPPTVKTKENSLSPIPASVSASQETHALDPLEKQQSLQKARATEEDASPIPSANRTPTVDNPRAISQEAPSPRGSTSMRVPMSVEEKVREASTESMSATPLAANREVLFPAASRSPSHTVPHKNGLLHSDASLIPTEPAPRQLIKEGKRDIKAASRIVDTPSRALERGRGKAIREARQAAGKARTASYAGSQAGETVKRTAKAAGNALLRTLKASLDDLKAFAAMLGAGGGVAFLVVLVLCMIALLFATPFGLFLAPEHSDSGNTFQTAIASLNGEFSLVIEQIQESHPHDVLDMDSDNIASMTDNWNDVLAVYAVLVTTDEASPGDAATLTPEKLNALRGVFWDMNRIDYALTEEEDPATGENKTKLSITVSTKDKDTIATEYGFSEEQLSLLDELTKQEYEGLFAALSGSDASLILTSAQMQQILSQMSAPVSATRQQVVMTAYQLKGKVNYFWGGKSLTLGWDTRWGKPAVVTAAGNSTSGTTRPFGLDCSGFVDWVFYNVSGGKYVIGHGGGASAQHTWCTPITWAEAMPGDLAFYPGDSHVGIIVGYDESGGVQIIHCAYSANNVVVTGKSGFVSVGRPKYYSEP